MTYARFKARIVHRGVKVRADGAVSALCSATARKIDRRSGWTMAASGAVTCPRCIEATAAIAATVEMLTARAR